MLSLRICPRCRCNHADELLVSVSVGGWPGHLRRTSSAAFQANHDYLEEVRRVDISLVDGTSRDPDRVGRFLRSYARNVATHATMATDTAGGEGPLKHHTALEHASSLTRLMVIEDQPAWAPHLRSKSILRNAPKRHFVDPSLAVAALRAGPDQLRRDLELFGLLFESLVVRGLRVYAQAADADVSPIATECHCGGSGRPRDPARLPDRLEARVRQEG